MEKSWGDNPVYGLMAWINLNDWSLPINIGWAKDLDAIDNSYFYLTIRVLCFGFAFEYWFRKSELV